MTVKPLAPRYSAPIERLRAVLRGDRATCVHNRERISVHRGEHAYILNHERSSESTTPRSARKKIPASVSSYEMFNHL
jgi:hypothetical protein